MPDTIWIEDWQKPYKYSDGESLYFFERWLVATNKNSPHRTTGGDLKHEDCISRKSKQWKDYNV